MHLQIAPVKGVKNGEAPRDLGQEPAEIVILSAADSELDAFTAAARFLHWQTLSCAGIGD